MIITTAMLTEWGACSTGIDDVLKLFGILLDSGVEVTRHNLTIAAKYDLRLPWLIHHLPYLRGSFNEAWPGDNLSLEECICQKSNDAMIDALLDYARLYDLYMKEMEEHDVTA